MINKVIIEGRLVYDPELKHYGAKNTSNVTTTLCCNWYQSAKNYTTYIEAVFWGRVAENLVNYCSKGSKIICVGRLVNNTYTNKNGVKVNKLQLVVDETSFDPKKSNENVQIDSSIFNETETFEPTEKAVINDEDLPFF